MTYYLAHGNKFISASIVNSNPFSNAATIPPGLTFTKLPLLLQKQLQLTTLVRGFCDTVRSILIPDSVNECTEK